MIRQPHASLSASRFATATFAAALAVSGLMTGSLAKADESAAPANPTGTRLAETSLPASASIVRNTIVALSLADAALPIATAVAATRDANPALSAPLTSAALKPDTASAMAAMRPTRRPVTMVSDNSGYERRVYRPYRDPFLLILGVAY